MITKQFTELYVDVTKKATKIPQENYLKQGKYPIVDQGREQIAGRWNDADGLFLEVPAIIFGDHTRAVKYIDEPFFIGADGVKVLRPINNMDNAKYYYYALQAARIPNLGYSRHFKVVKELMIRVYPRADQDKIVSLLEQLDELIDTRHSELSVLEQLVKSRFIEMFGDPNIEFKYESHKFKEFASDMTKGPFGSDMKKDLFVSKGEDTYKVYIQANAIQGDQNIGDYYISKEYFDSKIFRFEVHPGDYIITCDGTLGKHLRLNDEIEKGVISPSLLRLTLNEEKMTKEYFEYLWDMYMLLLMKKEARNACLVHLPSAKVIGEIDIPVPPFTMQNEFSRFVEHADKSKFEIQQSIDKLETLKKSLMQQYFG